MKKELTVAIDQETLTLQTDVTYGSTDYWFDGATYRDLKMSIIFPKQRTKEKKYPVIVWLCGGGWLSMDQDVWLPQMVHLAERGYVIVSPRYRTINEAVYPNSIIDIKSCIRYLRAHAEKYAIDEKNIFVGGESAGATNAMCCALNNGNRQMDIGDYPDYSSDVQGVLDFYGITNLDVLYEKPESLPDDSLMALTYPFFKVRSRQASVIFNVTEQMPPTLIFHGKQDPVVPVQQSIQYYEKLQQLNVKSDLYLIEDAVHGDPRFYQESVYTIIDAFIRDNLIEQ